MNFVRSYLLRYKWTFDQLNTFFLTFWLVCCTHCTVCSTGQRFICTEVTLYKIHTLNDIGNYLLTCSKLDHLLTTYYNFDPLYKIWKHLWIENTFFYNIHLYNSAGYLDNKLLLIDLSSSEFLPLTYCAISI